MKTHGQHGDQMNQIELSPSLVDRIGKLPAKTQRVLERLVHSARVQELADCQSIRKELAASAPKWVQRRPGWVCGPGLAHAG